MIKVTVNPAGDYGYKITVETEAEGKVKTAKPKTFEVGSVYALAEALKDVVATAHENDVRLTIDYHFEMGRY